MDINFCGYGENVATFLTSGTVAPGTPVKVSASGTVSACANGDNMAGVAINVRDGYAAVQLAGYVELATSDSTITPGFIKLCSAGSNKVKAASTGREYLVVTKSDNSVGIIL